MKEGKPKRRAGAAARVALLFFTVVSTLAGPALADEFYTRALEQAVSAACESLDAANLPAVRGLAVLPIRGDGGEEAYGLLRIAGTRTHFDVFDRSDAEWDRLLAEIEWNLEHEEIMNPRTVQEFGKIHGVDALLYGSITNVTRSLGSVALRLNLHLSVVETGEHAWGISVIGRNKDAGLAASSFWQRQGGKIRFLFYAAVVLIGIVLLGRLFLRGVQKPR